MNHYSSTRDTYLAQALTLSKQGLPVSTIVKLIPVDRATIYRWIAKFAVDNPQEEPSVMARKSKKDAQTQPEVPVNETLPDDVIAGAEGPIRVAGGKGKCRPATQRAMTSDSKGRDLRRIYQKTPPDAQEPGGGEKIFN